MIARWWQRIEVFFCAFHRWQISWRLAEVVWFPGLNADCFVSYQTPAPTLRHGSCYFLCKFQTATNLLTYCVIIIPMVTWWNASIFQPLQDNYKIMTKCMRSISLSKKAVSQLASDSLDKERYLHLYLIPCQTLYWHIPVSSLSQADADTCIKVRIGIFSPVCAFSQADTLCMINDSW